MYQLTNVTKLYTKGRRTVPAVRDLSLVIRDGEWLAIQGRTGHGKSTLLNLLGVLDRPTSGTIELDGKELTRLPGTQASRLRARSIGFIFQTFNLVPTLSAAENVEAALIPLRAGAAERRRRAAHGLAATRRALRRSRQAAQGTHDRQRPPAEGRDANLGRSRRCPNLPEREVRERGGQDDRPPDARELRADQRVEGGGGRRAHERHGRRGRARAQGR